MSSIAFIIGVIIVSIILRTLRSKFIWMDHVAVFIIIGATITFWSRYGFLGGVATFIVSLVVVGLLFGFGKETKVTIDGHTKGIIRCPHCDYGGMDIISSRYDSEQSVTSIKAKCKRCGKISHFKHR